MWTAEKAPFPARENGAFLLCLFFRINTDGEDIDPMESLAEVPEDDRSKHSQKKRSCVEENRGGGRHQDAMMLQKQG